MLGYSRILWIGLFLGGILAAGLASAAPVVTTCGATVGSIVRTETVKHSTTSTTFAPIPGANVVVNIPAGTKRCIKVEFAGANNDYVCAGGTCFMRAIDNGVEMNPQGETELPRSLQWPLDLQWVRRADSGNHTIVIQWRAATGAEIFFSRWTLNVEVTN